MNNIIGIRREDKNRWERRVPLIPEDVKRVINEYNTEVWIQPSKIRVFSNEDYLNVGAKIKEDFSDCPIVFAIKEIPLNFFSSGRTYLFFSHTIKGQSYNMGMLKKMMELKCQLIDYERVSDKNGKRLIAFGRFAGLSGMIETLWALGKRLKLEGIDNPFTQIKRAYEYGESEKAKEHLTQIGSEIAKKGLDNSISPMLFGFAGYGNVSGGAQEIIDCLPVKEVVPDEIPHLFSNPTSNRVVYKTVFKEKDMVENIHKDSFVLLDYYQHPSKYRSKFHRYVPYITVLMNCIYWEEKYPRLITKKFLKEFYQTEKTRLRVIGDISCDIEGAIECTSHPTTPDNPLFVYNPFTEQTIEGYEGVGPIIMAIDNLPCEIPVESSTYFSKILMRFIPDIVKADFSKSFEECSLPYEIKNGIILYKGGLTEKYKYLKQYL